MTSKVVVYVVALTLLATTVAGCGSSSKKGAPSTPTTAAQKIDYKALGLWDDGPCDTTKAPLKIGLMTTFDAPTISLKDQATALEAAAKAFNARGGANGACIDVHNCDDGANTDQAVACVRTEDQAGIVATVNDQGTAGQAEVSAAMAKAGIPRIASNVTQNDWGDQNAYPIDASGTGVTLLLPESLIKNGVKKIGIVRVDLAAASAIVGILNQLYKDEGATFPYDAPVPAGTTDYSQFILGAQNAGVGGIFLAVGDQDAIQTIRAAQQLGSSLLIGASLGSFSQKSVGDFGSETKNMEFMWSFPPATDTSVPVYQAMRADLAASGISALQPENLKASPIRSWIGLYALLRMIRDAHMTSFTRPGITAMLKKAKDVPMLGMFGGENWTPNLNHPGLFKRAGTNHWEIYKWDPNASGPVKGGNFVPVAAVNWDQTVCGSIFGSSGPC